MFLHKNLSIERNHLPCWAFGWGITSK